MVETYKPFHNIGPGEFIKEELEERGWLQTDLADILGISKKSVNKIIKNKQSITIETAKLLSKTFGQSPQYWINLDRNYRLRLDDLTANEMDTEIKATIYKYMPVKEMITKKWIPIVKNTKDFVEEVKKFWGIEAINFDFLDNKILPNFKKSETYKKFNKYYALTWFQMAKNCSKGYHIDEFNKNKLKELSLSLSDISCKENGIEILINELNKTGVKFFVLNHLQKTYTDGATFFDNNNPVIVYTTRHDRIDNFWFTVSHEIGHILLHMKSKEDFFIDEEKKFDTDEEKEANRFAANLLKERKILYFFKKTPKYITKSSVIACSSKLKINEAIIVGTLQHHNKLPWTHLKRFTPKASNCIPTMYWPDKKLI